MRALWLVVAAAAAARPPTRWLASRGGAKKTVEEDEPASIRLEVDAAVEDAADFDASGIELPEGQMDACGVFEGDVVEVSGAKGAHTLCVVKQREEDGDACALGRLARQNAAARVGGVVTVTPPSEGVAAATHVYVAAFLDSLAAAGFKSDVSDQELVEKCLAPRLERGNVPLRAGDRIEANGVEFKVIDVDTALTASCLLYTSPSPRDKRQSRMPSSA